MSNKSIDPNKSFYVVLHDVTPRFVDWSAEVVQTLNPLIGNTMAAAVVPQWHSDSLQEHTHEFVADLQKNFGEILLHGYFHQRATKGGLVSRLTGGADEFNEYNSAETSAMLKQGQQVMSNLYGKQATGFISPTFARGSLTAEILSEQGLQFYVGMRTLEFHDGRCIPLATWCWDMGERTFLGHLGDVYGYARMKLHRNLLPCLAIHPIDMHRGFKPKIVRLVETLLQQGRQPILIGESNK